MSQPPFLYLLSGLIIQSEINFPELLPHSHGIEPCEPDVVIRLGHISLGLDNALDTGVLYSARIGRFLLTMPGIARYLAQDGREIIVQPESSSNVDEVRLFLLGSVWSALLHQRGLLALHASAVLTPRGVVLLAGCSSAGKSALACAFYLRGYPVLADDSVAITVQGNTVLAHPSFPQLRIWPDVAYTLGINYDELLLLRPKLLKRAISVEKNFPLTPLPVHALYLLSEHNNQNVRIERVSGMARFHVLLTYTARERFLSGLGLRQLHFQQATQVAQRILISRIFRPDDPIAFDELIEKIAHDLDFPVPAGVRA
jgi:hypothetical protein